MDVKITTGDVALGRILALCGGLVACDSPPALHDATFIPPDAALFHVVNTTPDANATEVYAYEVLVGFDQPPDPSTVTPMSFRVTLDQVDDVAGTRMLLDSDPYVVRFIPEPSFPPGRQLAVQLTSDLRSTFGLALEPDMFSFMTDGIAPTVVTTSPLDMATTVPVTTSKITVTFSEPVHLDMLTFNVLQGATVIDGVRSPDDALGVTWAFFPSAALPAASVFTVVLGSGFTDFAGNPLTPTQFTFTTQ